MKCIILSVLLLATGGCELDAPLPKPAAGTDRQATTRSDPGTTRTIATEASKVSRKLRVKPIPKQDADAWLKRNRPKSKLKDGRWWPQR